MLACCSCLLTCNALDSTSVKQNLISNNLTPEIPSTVVIKLLFTVPIDGTSGTHCNAGNTSPVLAPGGVAWGTTLHALPTTPVTYGVTETKFSNAALSQGELNHLTTFCSFIQTNASGFGICKGCPFSGLGAGTTAQ